ncbi:MAG: Fe-S cluster assembly protein SufD [Methylococcaceae bacterium]|nr:Fe-S cluster assembly protein SufD [Methylococcaceae bacterium]MDD1616738.1 Fe-S cluster assembly protein SufD [Methylococcaceae bacterium]OYV16968.1 MAG: Fe-S cluster assembly protein SufD [Methylococcaceae bacterium NSP1-2]
MNAVAKNQSAWLQALRSEALTQFAAQGFPSPRDEDWRYTNVTAIEKKRFLPATNASTAVDVQAILTTYQLKDAWSVVLIDGYFSAELSLLEGLPEAVAVMSMANALDSQAETLQRYLGQAVSHTEHGFVAFNMAHFTDGLFVHIAAKQVVAKPIQVLHIATQADSLTATRTVIIAELMAEAELIETFVGVDNAYLTAAVTEVFVEDNAAITLTKVQYEADKAYHFGGTYVKQARNARFTHHNFAFGSLLARCDIHSDLDDAAECELNGLYLGAKRQHLDNHTRINHNKPHGISRELYKGILDDRARGVFQGRVVVAEDAQKTDSIMNNRNLLLSADAEADTKPQLEIYADDVKCGHGVTVGQLEEKSIFYLQSRAIDEETARNILTFAFANEMVDKITLPSLKAVLVTLLLTHFPQQGYAD